MHMHMYSASFSCTCVKAIFLLCTVSCAATAYVSALLVYHYCNVRLLINTMMPLDHASES